MFPEIYISFQKYICAFKCHKQRILGSAFRSQVKGEKLQDLWWKVVKDNHGFDKRRERDRVARSPAESGRGKSWFISKYRIFQVIGILYFQYEIYINGKEWFNKFMFLLQLDTCQSRYISTYKKQIYLERNNIWPFIIYIIIQFKL